MKYEITEVIRFRSEDERETNLLVELLNVLDVLYSAEDDSIVAIIDEERGEI